jgi:hypothetical protein
LSFGSPLSALADDKRGNQVTTGSAASMPQSAGAGGLGQQSLRRAAPAVDPQAPAPFRRWALRQRVVLDTRGNVVALTPGGNSGGGRRFAIACWLLSVACVVLVVAAPQFAGPAEWLAAAAVAAISAVTAQRLASRRDLRRSRSTVIFPENLDGTCLALLRRAQGAIASIRGSRLTSTSPLGSIVDDPLLDQHEWDIARQLQEITSLRSLLAVNSTGSSVGPMTTDVLRAQRRAIELALEATTTRVEALERHAGQIIAADQADRDWQRATTLSHFNDKYLDLVARTASDDYSAGELAGLTEQLIEAAKARDDRLREADLGASALVLPQPRPQPRDPATDRHS